MFCVRAFPYYVESSLVVLRCTLINVSAILFTVIYGNKLLDVITHIMPHRMCKSPRVQPPLSSKFAVKEFHTDPLSRVG